MLHNIYMRLLIILLFLLPFLSACVTTTSKEADIQLNSEIKEIEENALSLMQSGDYSEAAREYLNLSQKNEKRFTFYIIKAIDAFTEGKNYDKAYEILIKNTLNNQDVEVHIRTKILNAYIDLESGRPGKTLNLLNEITEDEIPKSFKIAFHEIYARSNLAHGNYIKAALEQLKLTEYLSSPKIIEDNSRKVWEIFELIPKSELEDLRLVVPDELLSWLELALINQTYKYQPKKLENTIDGWAQRYQNHDAYDSITKELINKSVQFAQRPSKIGLLLPLTGQYKKSSVAVRDGFLAAWYLDRQEKADIEIYNANSSNIIEIYQKALNDGADYIVGPLEKEATNQLYGNTNASIKILALNRQDLKNDQSGNKNLFQFGLSPEDEAGQVAKIAISDGHKRALVLTPDTPWGNRLADAFVKHWLELGGEVSKHTRFINNTTDFSSPVKELLNIDKSEQRARDLRNKLKIKIHNIERRRQDADFIFIAAIPEDARQLIPQLRFHYADNLPVYSTSHIFTGIIDSAKDIDLNDVIFIDMPWILDTKRQLSIVQDALNRNWSQEKSEYRRLYALGIDAYNLIPNINRLNHEEDSFMIGETGDLTIVRDNIIKRNLRKAKFIEGKPVLLN